MKKAGLFGFVSVLVGFVLLGTGCATPGRELLLTDVRPIALVSVVSNWDINWQGEDAVNPNLVPSAVRRSLRADPDMAILSNTEELINTAERLIRDSMAASGGLIILADRDTVLHSRAYQDAQLDRRRMNREHVLPAGYRLIDPRDRSFSPALAAETGIERSMFVDFTFTKLMRSGFSRTGNASAEVEMRVLILDVEGRTMYSRTFALGSRGRVSVANGMYSQSALMALFESAIVDACFEFLYHLEGL
ncbi:MAG: hypothetical protein FWB99_05320 [Treponema sp.]|nr:hypothetical protein [Treponema sp.]